jgi:HAD superfamily hydrolase (TIGR01549 family)
MNKLKTPIDEMEAILFDFDGVLCECMNVKTEAFEQLFSPFGPDIVKKVVKHHVKNGGISRYVKIRIYHEEFLNKKITDEEVEEIAQKFSDLVVSKVITSDWVKGAKEFIEKYYKSIDMFVISGTPQEELNKVIKNRNMQKYFKGVYGSPVRKPEHIRNIISEHNYDKNKVIYVGDSLSDMKDAKTANVPFLGRISPGEEFSFPKNIPTIRDFHDL